MFGSPGCWPVEGVGAIEGYRMFVTAAIRRLEGNIRKCVGGGAAGRLEGKVRGTFCGKPYRGRSIGDQVRTPSIETSVKEIYFDSPFRT